MDRLADDCCQVMECTGINEPIDTNPGRKTLHIDLDNRIQIAN
jgi:hypothetical protein